MKADAHFADVLGWIGRVTKARQDIHLPRQAFGTVCRAEPNPAMAHARFEVIELK